MESCREHVVFKRKKIFKKIQTLKSLEKVVQDLRLYTVRDMTHRTLNPSTGYNERRSTKKSPKDIVVCTYVPLF